jgi:hypothetical protein
MIRVVVSVVAGLALGWPVHLALLHAFGHSVAYWTCVLFVAAVGFLGGLDAGTVCEIASSLPSDDGSS